MLEGRWSPRVHLPLHLPPGVALSLLRLTMSGGNFGRNVHPKHFSVAARANRLSRTWCAAISPFA
jgi:hypothetical protein